MDNKNDIVWEAAEFNQVEKSFGWYLIFGILFIAMIIFGFASRDFFFVIFLLLAGILVIALGGRKPENIKFTLGEDGCKIGNSETIYRYSDMTGFAIVEKSSDNNLLVLRQKSTVNPYLKVPIKKSMTEDVKLLLGSKLEQREYEETLLDVLIERVGL